MKEDSYYDDISDSYNELHGEEQKKKLILILPFIDSDSVLDVGCATGIASPRGSIGVDPSKKLLVQNTVCKKTYEGKGEKLPFPHKSFDIITCLTVIHHCDLKQALAEFKRVARKKIIISVLKRAQNYSTIVAEIKKELKVIKEIEEEKDRIFVIFVCAM